MAMSGVWLKVIGSGLGSFTWVRKRNKRNTKLMAYKSNYELARAIWQKKAAQF